MSRHSARARGFGGLPASAFIDVAMRRAEKQGAARADRPVFVITAPRTVPMPVVGVPA